MSSRRAKAINLDVYLEKAFFGSIEIDDIHDLSLSTRCALIKRLLDAMKHKNKAHPTNAPDISLTRLCKTFEISEGFHDWQRRKRQALIKALTAKENRSILTGFRNWNKISRDSQKFVLRKSVQLHRKIYVEGMTEPLPYRHDFQEGAVRNFGNKLSIVFGNFNGDLKTGHGKITQYTLHGLMQESPLEAFDTAHHEGTHLIQHHLSYAFHRNQILPSHPLYHEAAYFHSVDLHKAYIPSIRSEPYRVQPHEVFAHWEGGKIASAIQALAL